MTSGEIAAPLSLRLSCRFQTLPFHAAESDRHRGPAPISIGTWYYADSVCLRAHLINNHYFIDIFRNRSEHAASSARR